MKKFYTVFISSFAAILLLSIAAVIFYRTGIIEISPSAPETAETEATLTQPTPQPTPKPIIVLDPGHGKSSSQMTAEEKENEGWIYSPQKSSWGEWRHWKNGTVWQDCEGSGCNHRAPANGGCWYRIENGDRDIEPQINLNNALAAKEALEQMGYEVRITRTDNSENPSMTKRLRYCYPDFDISKQPDADLFVCLHSNAGGGRGTCYIELSGQYDQAGIPDDYAEKGNRIGRAINRQIAADTGLAESGSGVYRGYPELILFCKSPVPIAYLEIGFFDNPEDLRILQSESKEIGTAIAKGIDSCLNQQSR